MNRVEGLSQIALRRFMVAKIRELGVWDDEVIIALHDDWRVTNRMTEKGQTMLWMSDGKTTFSLLTRELSESERKMVSTWNGINKVVLRIERMSDGFDVVELKLN